MTNAKDKSANKPPLPPKWEWRFGSPCLVHEGTIYVELRGDPDGVQAWAQWLAKKKEDLTPKRMLHLLECERQCAVLERERDEARAELLEWREAFAARFG